MIYTQAVRGRKPLYAARSILTVATGRGEPLHDLDAARRYLADLPKVDDEWIGVIGFCIGGGFVAETDNEQLKHRQDRDE